MKTHLAISLIGSFLLNDEGSIIDVRYFDLNSKEVAKKFNLLNQSEFPLEFSEMLKEHKSEELIVDKSPVYKILLSKGFKVVFTHDDFILDQFYKNLIQYAIDSGLFKNESDYFTFIRETSILITREKVRLAAEKRDSLIVHAIETIDDIDKTLNLFSSRLREFYGMHFPELSDEIENHYTYAQIISNAGEKANISKKFLVDKLNLPEKKVEALLGAREKSMGSQLLGQDIQIIKDQAKLVVDLYERRSALEKWMEEAMHAVAPNLSGTINPLIGARLISLAGGLRALALCPSSKIQVLGAEKALYRTIKTGAPPPKHGIIFQDPRLNQAKWWQRGKIARVISGRLSIAARMDFFEAEDKSSQFANEVNTKIKEIKEKYPEPLAKPKPIPKKEYPPKFQAQKGKEYGSFAKNKKHKKGSMNRKNKPLEG